MEGGTNDDNAHNVTIIAETFGNKPETVASVNSENSTEQLICKSPQKKVNKSIESKVESGSVVVEAAVDGDGGCGRTLLALGGTQVALGALLVSAGGVAVVRGAALARVGAGLWAGGVGVIAGVVGLLAGIHHCYDQQHKQQSRNPLLSAYLALSLASFACANGAAVLAATGLHRDYHRGQPMPQLVPHLFEEEMSAWAPVLTNIVVVIVATLHCVVSIVAVYYTSRRVCVCWRTKAPYEHNQFDPNYKQLTNYVININEASANDKQQLKITNDINKQVDKQMEQVKQKEHGSANSRERLVNTWLGMHAPHIEHNRQTKVRKYKMKPQPVMLVPAHPNSTLGRVAVLPPPAMLLPPRYATLPLAPAHYHPPPPIYYSAITDTRMRRRRSPRDVRTRRRPDGSSKDSQLTRSLERIHRKRRAERRAERERATDNELKQTYTGLDRAYAEQYIAVCDESRSHVADNSSPHSLTSTDTNCSDLRDSY